MKKLSVKDDEERDKKEKQKGSDISCKTLEYDEKYVFDFNEFMKNSE